VKTTLRFATFRFLLAAFVMFVAAGCNLVLSTPTPNVTATPPAAATPTFIGAPSITPLPQPGATAAPTCQIPSGWVPYVIEPGDNLTTIAESTGSTVAALLAGNCIENPDQIFAGQSIFVPFVPGAAPGDPGAAG
jgi:hypothetical protein